MSTKQAQKIDAHDVILKIQYVQCSTRTVKFMVEPSEKHLEAVYQVMHYETATQVRGLVFVPRGKWDGSSN